MQQLDLYIKGKHILMRKLEKYEANKLNFSIIDNKFKIVESIRTWILIMFFKGLCSMQGKVPGFAVRNARKFKASFGLLIKRKTWKSF